MALKVGTELRPLAGARRDADIKHILGGLASVACGIGALRSNAGDAHGRGRGTPRVDARVTRLAFHSASTLPLFFIETWRERAGEVPSQARLTFAALAADLTTPCR